MARVLRTKAAIVAWAAALVTVASIVVDFWLAIQNGTQTAAQLVIPTVVLLAVVGAIVVTRKPRDGIGWILSTMAFISAVGGLIWDHGYRAIAIQPSLPFGIPIFWLANWVWLPVVGVGMRRS